MGIYHVVYSLSYSKLDNIFIVLSIKRLRGGFAILKMKVLCFMKELAVLEFDTLLCYVKDALYC